LNFLIRWILALVAVWATVIIAQFTSNRLGLPVNLEWGGAFKAFLFIIVLAVVNALIRPLVKLFTWPINCLTFGLFAFIVNALMFWLAAAITGGVTVTTFWAALFGSIVLSVLSGLINSYAKRRSRADE
jgi:putative membrane protein